MSVYSILSLSCHAKLISYGKGQRIKPPKFHLCPEVNRSS